ncbi:hypothetical protein B5M09_010222 [Aphanomyces astaci]|uniref:Temptin Cys/Cys disulfide domain-containing protein n=1 Tax=Aphanomyces astaci TaxID=112090 RepID=A0A3R7WFR8_APHAT|nr:hypothetical protein B5M09_010222 [Aphanomyces astaci]
MLSRAWRGGIVGTKEDGHKKGSRAVCIREKTQASVTCAAVVGSVHAYSEFRYKIPNGFEVEGFSAVGHANKVGGGDALSSFGNDFIDAGYKWSKLLCAMDSDGDGATNGEELGDPCCKWNEIESDYPLRSSQLSSPGHPDAFSDADLAAIQCHLSNDEL